MAAWSRPGRIPSSLRSPGPPNLPRPRNWRSTHRLERCRPQDLHSDSRASRCDAGRVDVHGPDEDHAHRPLTAFFVEDQVAHGAGTIAPTASIADRDESVAAFVERHYGSEMVDRLADPLLSGVYGGEAANLSVRAVLPRFAEMERLTAVSAAPCSLRAKKYLERQASLRRRFSLL